IENSRDGLAVVDTKGCVTYSNSAFDTFLSACGGSPKEVLSMKPENVIRGSEVIESIRANLSHLAPGASWSTELMLLYEKDRAYQVSLSALPPSSEGNHLGRTRLVVWVRDISEQKRRERFQRELVSTTSHDLKGPLGAIITGSELLSELVKDH